MFTVDALGNEREITECTAQDVDVHLAIVEPYIRSEDLSKTKENMLAAIATGSAYTLSDNSSFLYYRNYTSFSASVDAFYGKNAPIQMMALFVGIFTELDKHTFKLDIHLHEGDSPTDYVSMTSEVAIKRSFQPDHPLVIRVDHLMKKIKKLYEKGNRNGL